MSLQSVIAKLRAAPGQLSLVESHGVSNRETQLCNPCEASMLRRQVESVESESMSYTCARTRARARARGARLGKRDSIDSRDPKLPPPGPSTVLKFCRCLDCRRWLGEPLNECTEGIIRNGTRTQPEVPADGWHYCALYRGPQVSGDVWVWPKGDAAEKEPALGGGGPSSGPIQSGPAGGEPAGQAPLYAAEPELPPPSCDSGQRAAHVGPRSQDSAESPIPAPNATKRDTGGEGGER